MAMVFWLVVALLVAACGQPEDPDGALLALTPVPTRVAGVTAVATAPARRAAPTARPARTASPESGGVADVLARAVESAREPLRAAGATATPAVRLETVVAAQLGPFADDPGDEHFGVVVENLATGERFSHNEARRFPSGSVYKLVVAWEVLRRVDQGLLRLDDELTIQPGDALEAEPEGGVALGERVTIRQALEAMMGVSSNAASHALLRTLGRGELNASLRRQGLTATGVPLLRGEAGQSAGTARAVTSPRDMAYLLGLLAGEATLSPATRAELHRLLALEEPLDPLREGAPRSAEVLAKTGTLEDATNAAGLLMTSQGPVVVAVFTSEAAPGRAHDLIAGLAEAVYRTYAPEP